MTLLVFPHCDMHLALNTPRANRINFRVFRYLNQGPFTLDDVTSDCAVQMLAPYNPVGSRLDEFVDIDVNAETITATSAGTNLVIFHYTNPADADDSEYVVARIQVHDRMVAWWFGNRSVTTALDPVNSHAQPSIYASFSDDPARTDIVGDITGHDFVALDSSDPTTFTIDNADHRGRLVGFTEGSATLNGAFLGIDQSIPVEVVDYATPPNPIEKVRINDLPNAQRLHNILFLAEGFRIADRPKFDEIVRRADEALFSKPRHEPFASLSGSFNVFKAFTPSTDHLITCGFRVTDKAVDGQRQGRPIPNDHSVSLNEQTYTPQQLIARVGLPLRGEVRSRSALLTDWLTRSLHDFDAARVDDRLVEAWKASRPAGYLEARDTYFGMVLGSRWADRNSSPGAPLAAVATDDGSAPLRALVRRAYEFNAPRVATRILSMDRRRHAPELFLQGHESPTSSVMRFIGALHLRPGQSGDIWVPGGPDFKPSRGLVVMIVNEPMHGGTSINDNTLVALNVNHHLSLVASYVPNPPPPATPNDDMRVMRRGDPAAIDVDFAATIDTIAHELGHSMRLGDEYEERAETADFRQLHLNAAANQSDNFDRHDNITSLETIFVDPNFLNNQDRRIDVDKVKWAHLPRIRLSAKLIVDSTFPAGKIVATIDPRETQPWKKEMSAGTEIYLRSGRVPQNGVQLPLPTGDADFLIGLKIESVDTNTGQIVLKSTLPLAAPPDFRAGSWLFIPHRIQGGAMRMVIDPKVRDELATSRTPLNSDTDASQPKDGPDDPRAIGGFEPPCVGARVIGVYEGASRWSGLVYRPAGTCKMRAGGGRDQHGEYCHVCKWLITNRVDPGAHALVDRKFYPSADVKKKKRKKGKR